MSPIRKQLVRGAVEVLIILAAHVYLLHTMADRQIVCTVLAGGSHVPRGIAFAAGLFVLVRLYAVLLLPGVILARVVSILLAYRRQITDAE